MKIDGLNTDTVTLGFVSGVTLSISGLCNGDTQQQAEPLFGGDDMDYDPFADSDCEPAVDSPAFRALPSLEQKRLMLAHYAKRQPKEFRKFDVFTGSFLDDLADKEGDVMFGGSTHELMRGIWDVRCLINPKLAKADVVRTLRKVLAWIERDGLSS